MLKKVKASLEPVGNPEKANVLQGFFKTGKGEYGEGDVFLGISVPEQRKLAKKHNGLSLGEVRSLLSSKVHEYRLTGLLILVSQYKREPSRRIVDFYLENKSRVNNWDLVDLTAPNILGDWLLKNPEERRLLRELVKEGLWDRRIAIISTLAFIRKGEFEETFRLAELLLKDEHDLIHKAVGWMLREVGKRDLKAEEKFLDKWAGKMPRTSLRYAIERFPDSKRKHYMRKVRF